MKTVFTFCSIVTLMYFSIGCSSPSFSNMSYHQEDSSGNYPFKEQDDLNTAETSDNQKTKIAYNKITYDEGHKQLQKVMDKLAEYARNLHRADYIGYQYSTGQLYKYLLAINYKAEGLLDKNYKYNYNFSSFEELCDTYHENVDFSSVELVNMQHKGSDIEIDFSYRNKKTNQNAYLKYHLSYGIHGVTDKSVFN
jgi:hypothetical protein